MPPFFVPAPPPATTIQGPDAAPQSGAVSLAIGNNVGITRSGKTFTLFANPPGPRRPLSVFAPGAITARTLQKATIPSAVLQQLDVFALTPPVGVSGAACGNVVVAGSVSGQIVLPMSTAVSEWHLGPTDLAVPAGSMKPAVGHSDTLSARGGAYRFTPSANLTLYNFALTWTNQAPSGVGNGANPTTVRVGIAKGVSLGRTPTLADPSGGAVGGGWITGTDGFPCWLEIDASAVNLGQAIVFVPPGTQGYPLVQGTEYQLVVMHENFSGANGSTAIDTTITGFNPTVSGNITMPGLGLFYTNDTQSGGVYQAWTEFVNLRPGNFALYTGIVGLTLSGLCVVSTSLTGAPATPGSDIEIYAQF